MFLHTHLHDLYGALTLLLSDSTGSAGACGGSGGSASMWLRDMAKTWGEGEDWLASHMQSLRTVVRVRTTAENDVQREATHIHQGCSAGGAGSGNGSGDSSGRIRMLSPLLRPHPCNSQQQPTILIIPGLGPPAQATKPSRYSFSTASLHTSDLPCRFILLCGVFGSAATSLRPRKNPPNRLHHGSQSVALLTTIRRNLSFHKPTHAARLTSPGVSSSQHRQTVSHTTQPHHFPHLRWRSPSSRWRSAAHNKNHESEQGEEKEAIQQHRLH